MQALIDSGEFLTLSRRNPELFDTPSSFLLSNGIAVNVSAPGIIEFTPANNNEARKKIVLSCGVHGNETAPIEICDELVKNILTEKLVIAHHVLFLFGNLPAMDIAQRFVEENMNRLFSGAHSEGKGLINAERVRANCFVFIQKQKRQLMMSCLYRNDSLAARAPRVSVSLPAALYLRQIRT